MTDTPPPVPDSVTALQATDAQGQALPTETRPDGTLEIDLLPLAPPPPAQCLAEEPDALNPEIIVCRQTGPSPRIGLEILPDVDDFAIGIPSARIRLSDTATLEANTINQGVGGFNANGGELRLKIDF